MWETKCGQNTDTHRRTGQGTRRQALFNELKSTKTRRLEKTKWVEKSAGRTDEEIRNRWAERGGRRTGEVTRGENREGETERGDTPRAQYYQNLNTPYRTMTGSQDRFHFLPQRTVRRGDLRAERGRGPGANTLFWFLSHYSKSINPNS